MTHRAPVRAAAEAVRSQEGLRQVANSQRIPALVLTSSYGRVAYPSRGLPGYDEFLTNWSVSLGVQVPLFTGGRIKGERLVADAGVEEARLRMQQTTKQAQTDTRNALAQLEASAAALKASEGTASQASRAYQIADLRFREGVSTQTELLDARIALEQASVNRAQAARDLQIARVRVALLAELPLSGASAPTAPTAPARPRQPAPQTQSVTATGQP